MHSHNMAAVTLSQYKSKKDSWVIACALAWVHFDFFVCAKDATPNWAWQRLVFIVQVQQDACRAWTYDSRLRFCLAWFLHLAAAKVTKSRPWPPHVFAQDFFRWQFECCHFSSPLRLENVGLRKVHRNIPFSEGRALYRVTQKDVYPWKFQLWLWLKSYLFQITTTHYSVYGRPFTRV